MFTPVAGVIEEVLNIFATALDWDGEHKLLHARRTALLSALLAEEICPDMTEELLRAGLLHDIGAIGLTDHIIHLFGERNNPRIFAHPWRGGVMLSLMELNKEAEIVRYHHEAFDGTGYPLGLKGDEIPLGSRIVGLADYVDICLYQNPEITKARLEDQFRDNPQFDPKLVDALFPLLTPDIWGILHDSEAITEELRRFWLKERGLKDKADELDQLDLVVEVLAQIIDCRHTYTAGHSYRVSFYSVGVGEALNLNQEELRKLRQASLLHDIGKLAVPKKLLDKPGKLTAFEWRIVKQHPVLSRELLAMAPFFADIAPIAGAHHERLDGSGYPDGLKGEEIPYLARIISITDAFDALTSNRPYTKNLTVEAAIKVLQKSEGHFDKEILIASVPVLASLGNEIWRYDTA